MFLVNGLRKKRQQEQIQIKMKLYEMHVFYLDWSKAMCICGISDRLVEKFENLKIKRKTHLSLSDEADTAYKMKRHQVTAHE